METAVWLLWMFLGCGAVDEEIQAEVVQEVEPENIAVRLALNWFPEPEFGGFYEGVLGGHYEKAGFDVEIIPGGPGAPSLELMTAGRVEVAITSADDLLVKRAKGVNAVAAWPAFQMTPQGLMVHETGPADFAAIGSLPDAQVAIEVGGAFQQFLWKKFSWDGIVKPVPYGGSVGPFLLDESYIQQAYITSEPCAVRARGKEVRFLQGSEAGWNPYGSVLAFTDPPPSWAEAFVEATDQAWRAYMADPEQANHLISQLNRELSDSMLACITEAQRPFIEGSDGIGTMTYGRWQELATTLVDLGLLPPGSSALGAWRNDFDEEGAEQ